VIDDHGGFGSGLPELTLLQQEQEMPGQVSRKAAAVDALFNIIRVALHETECGRHEGGIG